MAGSIKTRAVHFNGATSLTNFDLKKLVDFTTPRECGIISYWYKSFIGEPGTILLGYSALYTSLHVIRVAHLQVDVGASSVYPSLELARANGTPDDTLSLSAASESLPIDDGRWHNVVWTWKVTMPIMAACCIDGQQVGLIVSVLNGRSFTGFSIDFDNVDQWRIAGEVAPLFPTYYDGDLAELFMQIEDDYYDPVISTINTIIESSSMGRILVGGRGFRTDEGFAMELGPDGSGALAISNNKPQIFCSGDASSPPTFLAFRNNVTGTDPRKFGVYAGNLSTASSDPFP